MIVPNPTAMTMTKGRTRFIPKEVSTYSSSQSPMRVAKTGPISQHWSGVSIRKNNRSWSPSAGFFGVRRHARPGRTSRRFRRAEAVIAKSGASTRRTPRPYSRCPSFDFFVSRYFSLCGFVSVRMGTCSTICMPYPSRPTTFLGLLVRNRNLRTPRSKRICAPSP